MYRFTPILIVACIVAIASFSVQAECDENETAAEKSRIPGWFPVDTTSQRGPYGTTTDALNYPAYRPCFTSSNSN